jgi:RNA polymerase-binding protein DksA
MKKESVVKAVGAASRRPGDTRRIEEFRRRLRQARRQLLQTVVTTDEELATLEAPQPGSPSEGAGTELTAAVLSRLEGQQRHELDEIADAQARLEAGTYGVCESCGTAIPLARLRAQPTARTCVGCRERQEARAAAAR